MIDTRIKPTLEQYGKRTEIKVNRKTLIFMFVLFCIVTPCTNWLIPFSSKIVKKGFYLAINHKEDI